MRYLDPWKQGTKTPRVLFKKLRPKGFNEFFGVLLSFLGFNGFYTYTIPTESILCLLKN